MASCAHQTLSPLTADMASAADFPGLGLILSPRVARACLIDSTECRGEAHWKEVNGFSYLDGHDRFPALVHPLSDSAENNFSGVSEGEQQCNTQQHFCRFVTLNGSGRKIHRS